MNIHNGFAESSDLSGWVEWAEESDPDNEGGAWDFPLVSERYVLELLQQIREVKIDTEEFIKLLKNPVKDEEDKHENT